MMTTTTTRKLILSLGLDRNSRRLAASTFASCSSRSSLLYSTWRPGSSRSSPDTTRRRAFARAFFVFAFAFSTGVVVLSGRAMSSSLVPSRPADVMVIRHVTPHVVTFSVPFSRFGKIKIGGRGTLVKLTSGNLAVFSPVALTEESRAKVAELGGKVGYIVALDFEHHIFVSEWAKHYPGAKIIGPEGLPEKRAKQQHSDPNIGNDAFTVVFTKANKRGVKISDEFDADFDYEYVDGHVNREIVFNYRPDRVLIEADLVFNLPAVEQYSRVPEGQKPGGCADKLFQGAQSTAGDATWMKRFNWYLAAKDRASFNDSLKVIDQWDFATLIPCHGEVMEGDAKETFRKVFQWHLQGKK